MRIKITEEIQIRGLGKKIERARKLNGYTLTELGGKAGISANQWRRIEREDYVVPKETLNRVLHVVGLATLDEIANTIEKAQPKEG